MKSNEISSSLVGKGLKVTPQRIAVFEAILKLNNHPSAEHILEYIRKTHPNIATGTVYKVLDVLADKGLIHRVKTERDVMRYDAVLDRHHHLYCIETERIEDYSDKDLDNMLTAYFKKRGIPGFTIEDVKLQIVGTFDKSN
ncbi:MAG: transcriptional repressor [Bacteroidales bacterium]|nr:transcriptional repressor [Bacteroidales bacterium]